jgi:hypothetical protein
MKSQRQARGLVEIFLVPAYKTKCLVYMATTKRARNRMKIFIRNNETKRSPRSMDEI